MTSATVATPAPKARDIESLAAPKARDMKAWQRLRRWALTTFVQKVDSLEFNAVISRAFGAGH